MALEVGTKLGLYEILEPIGKGGMGEVYRARDTKLGREVAIKVLPEAFAENEERLARFEREAKVLAQLNHPGIAHLYGLERSEGVDYLAMELVDGETLAERIARGPIPVDEALPLCQQIAEALEAAHEKGIIHRDLKPANIKVNSEGQVKVLDFGLAKAFAEESAETDSSFSPTLTRDSTRAGVILGTAAYMSPEQAKGKAVDKRTDIFSFGIVLYEMLTGRKAFAGEDVSDVLASIIKMEPDWRAVSDFDPRTQNLLRRCLKKDRKNRRQSIGDVRVEIEDILADPAGGSHAAAAVVVAQPVWRRAMPFAAGVVVSGLLVGVAAWSLWPTAQVPRVTRLTLTLPPDVSLKFNNGLSALALSPDGRRLAFVGETDEGSRLYLRDLDRAEIVPISGTEGAEEVTFSPDGRWVAFTTDRDLKKLELGGGAPVVLCEVRRPLPGYVGGLTWTSEDAIVFSDWFSLFTVPATGGSPEAVAVPTESAQLIWPQVLPRGGGVLFTAARGVSQSSSIGLYSPRSRAFQTVVENGYGGRYLSSGHLLFVRSAELYVAPFDPSNGETTGAAVRVLDEELVDPWGNAPLAVSASGTIVYTPGPYRNRLIWMTRQGQVTPLSRRQRAYEFIRFSPDGRKLAVGIEELRHVAHFYDIERDTLTPLVKDIQQTDTPIWTPDGEKVIFMGSDGGPWNLFWKASDGSGSAEQLTTAELFHLPSSVSPDGSTLTFWTPRSTAASFDIWVVDLAGEGRARLLVAERGAQRDPRFSPDGQYLAYDSNEDGRTEVWVRPFPGPGGAIKISNEGGYDPLWAPHGRELFYRIGRKIMVVEIETEPTFAPGKPELLFLGPNLGDIKHWRAWDVAPDGERFVAVEQASAPTELFVILNWTEELRHLVPSEN